MLFWCIFWQQFWSCVAVTDYSLNKLSPFSGKQHVQRLIYFFPHCTEGTQFCKNLLIMLESVSNHVWRIIFLSCLYLKKSLGQWAGNPDTGCWGLEKCSLNRGVLRYSGASIMEILPFSVSNTYLKILVFYQPVCPYWALNSFHKSLI